MTALATRLRATDAGIAGRVGAGLLAVFAVAAALAPVLAPFSPTERVGVPYARPDGTHLLGTDDVGRDLLSGLLHGARTSLLIGLGVAVLSLAVGALVGATAGARRGWVDAVLMRLVDVVLSLPFLPLVVVVAAFAGRGLPAQILMLATLLWARPARIIRAQVLTAMQRGHVEAAEAMGGTRRWQLWRHVSFYVAPLLVPLVIRAAMVAILLEASLAFLGLGDTARISWGTMLYWANVRAAVLSDAWLWWVVPPGLAIAGLVVSLGLIGLSVEERLNPTLTRGVGGVGEAGRAA